MPAWPRPSSERLRMDEAGEKLETIHDAGAIAVQEVAVGRVQPPAPDRRQALEPLPLLAGRGPRTGAVASQDDDLRRAPHGGFQAHARIALALVRGDRLAASRRDQLREE